MTVDQLNQEDEKQKSLATPTMVGKWLMSIRVGYTITVAVGCWFALALVFYFLRVLGFIDGR